MDPAELMRLAIEKCRAGIAAGQSPFGCAIARDGEVLSCSHNTVVLTTDITAHAEVNAIREACRRSRRYFPRRRDRGHHLRAVPDVHVRTALGARRYGVLRRDDRRRRRRPASTSCNLPAAELLRIGGSKLKLVPQVLPDECKQLFAEWKANPKRKVY